MIVICYMLSVNYHMIEYDIICIVLYCIVLYWTCIVVDVYCTTLRSCMIYLM